jgi:hypothetical protein
MLVDGLETRRAGFETRPAASENRKAFIAREQIEESDSNVELIVRFGIDGGKHAEPTNQGFAACGGDRVHLACLAALPFGFIYGDPLLIGEAAEERVDEVVVDVTGAKDLSGTFFDGVTVPRTFEEKGEDQ